MGLLKMNDVFNTGVLGINVVLAVIEKYGIKLTNQEGIALARFIGNDNEEIPIY